MVVFYTTPPSATHFPIRVHRRAVERVEYTAHEARVPRTLPASIYGCVVRRLCLCQRVRAKRTKREKKKVKETETETLGVLLSFLL